VSDEVLVEGAEEEAEGDHAEADVAGDEEEESDVDERGDRRGVAEEVVEERVAEELVPVESEADRHAAAREQGPGELAHRIRPHDHLDEVAAELRQVPGAREAPDHPEADEEDRDPVAPVAEHEAEEDREDDREDEGRVPLPGLGEGVEPDEELEAPDPPGVVHERRRRVPGGDGGEDRPAPAHPVEVAGEVGPVPLRDPRLEREALPADPELRIDLGLAVLDRERLLDGGDGRELVPGDLAEPGVDLREPGVDRRHPRLALRRLRDRGLRTAGQRDQLEARALDQPVQGVGGVGPDADDGADPFRVGRAHEVLGVGLPESGPQVVPRLRRSLDEEAHHRRRGEIAQPVGVERYLPQDLEVVLGRLALGREPVLLAPQPGDLVVDRHRGGERQDLLEIVEPAALGHPDLGEGALEPAEPQQGLADPALRLGGALGREVVERVGGERFDLGDAQVVEEREDRLAVRLETGDADLLHLRGPQDPHRRDPPPI
jgi:hypothetical protein